jgi:hypothetical protein
MVFNNNLVTGATTNYVVNNKGTYKVVITKMDPVKLRMKLFLRSTIQQKTFPTYQIWLAQMEILLMTPG